MQSETFELKHRFVQAGAGAGKTSNLIESIYQWANIYYEKHGRFPRLVVCTFTVKATQELKDRLSAKAIQEENYKFLDYVKDRSQLFVSTIHGVLNYFLKSNSLHFHFDPFFEIQSYAQFKKVATKEIYKILEENEDFRFLLNYYSLDQLLNYCIEFYKFDLTGKVCYSPDKKYIEEKWHKLEANIVKNINQASVLLDNICHILKEKKSKSLDKTQQLKSVLSSISSIDTLREKKDFFLGSSFPRIQNKEIKEEAKEVKKVFDEIKDYFEKGEYDKDFWLKRASNINSFHKLATKFSTVWHDLVLTRSFVCLNYIEELSYYMISKNSFITKKFSEKWDYWFVDEFQDTSRLQVQILKSLINDRPYYLVGDAQQSIYLFRGSDVNVFYEEKESFEKTSKEIYYLEKNYRSQPGLLHFINDVFIPQNFLEMKPKEDVQEKKEAAKVIFSEDESKQLEVVASEIGSLLATGVEASKIAVLSRTNKELTELEGFLKKKNIPYIFNTNQGFFDKRLIKDLLYFIKFLYLPSDNYNLCHLLRSPLFHLDEEVLATCTRKANEEEISLWSLIKEKPELEELKAWHLLFQEMSWLDLVSRLILEKKLLKGSYLYDESGVTYTSILKLFHWLSLKEKEGRNQIVHVIDQIFSGENFDMTNPSSPDENERIQLMTVHKSKGLQFEHVFIINIDKGFRSQADKNYFLNLKDDYFSLAFPYGEEQSKKHPFYAKKEIQSIKEDETKEHLRLFYVAVTRAREMVHFHGNITKKIPLNSWLSFLPNKFLVGFESENYLVSDKLYQASENYKTNKIKQRLKPLNPISNSHLRFSVSDLTSKQNLVEKENATKKHPLDLVLSSYEGNRIHQELEMLKYKNNSEIKERYKSIFTNEDLPLEEILLKGSVEWGFAYKLDNAIFEGKVDLWALLSDKLWVVDYKSGTEHYKEKAFFQLNAYSLPIRDYTKREDAFLAVVYPTSGKIFIKKAKDKSLVRDHLLSSSLELAKRLSKPNPM